MRRAHTARKAGTWPAARQAGTVTLSYLERHRRRLRLVTDQGEPLLLDLAKAVLLGEGDGLELDEGGFVEVRAAKEALLEIRAGTAGLARLAYHLGNRHLPIQLLPDALLIRDDHVIADMVRGLGGEVRAVTVPFTPEAGAYAGGHDHSSRFEDE
ncbi:MAG TPA: urease accessory protein UreE [Aliidongia sp.]|uniref:urease accessory protein UreE n=1 Tax=Aliidongia sp. TaxID=1914230 RepID=UPI002DDCC4DB|nr:urease accessory protein UreE [Aliidongia sp.]HEV2676342.1 urease accessory protein UreE [Aliidongia sp.]